MIDCIHETLTKPDFTAVMEFNLSAIAEGKVSLDKFMSETTEMVLSNIEYAEDTTETRFDYWNRIRESFDKVAMEEAGHE